MPEPVPGHHRNSIRDRRKQTQRQKGGSEANHATALRRKKPLSVATCAGTLPLLIYSAPGWSQSPFLPVDRARWRFKVHRAGVILSTKSLERSTNQR
jgi:hypothetical protein